MAKAEVLLKRALKAAPKREMVRTALEAQITAQLVAAGKPQRKALIRVAEALALPCFVLRDDGTVAYVKDAAAAAPPAAAAPAPKRKPDEGGADKKKKKQKQPLPNLAFSPRMSPRLQAQAAAKAAAVVEMSLDGPPPADEKKGGKKQKAKPAEAAGASAVGALGAVAMMGAAEAEAYRSEHRIAVSAEDGTADGFRPVRGFADAGFSDAVLRATRSFKTPTPIQAQCWPIMMAGRDCVGVAETGSGKTLAFFLPAMMHCAAAGVCGARKSGGGGPTVLILAPTRELAMQSDDVCRSAGGECGLSSVCIYGGVPKGPQRQAIRDGAQVVVATPGRLLDLHEEGACALGGVTYLVLDEADRMLDMGFEKDVRAIVNLTSASRRTLMFTATWPETIRELASEFLSNPVRVNVGSVDLAANVRVTQTVEVIDGDRKEARLVPLLNQYHKSRSNRVLVFALYKKEAARLEVFVKRHGFNGLAIHGDMTQAARTAALGKFKDGSCPLLIATDVAARGLDIPDVEVVINYSFPLTIEDYIHRIGRTGRGGKTGVSHTLFTSFDKGNAGALQNVLREAGQEVPEALLRFGSAVKKKEHKMYGAFSGGGAPMKQATKIVF